jgi:hypothetical protein
MLMALIFTAMKDYKAANELVEDALNEFPSYYGLLVLHMKLKARNRCTEEVLSISRELIYFWRRTKLAPHLSTDEETLKPINPHPNGDILQRHHSSFVADQNPTIHKLVFFFFYKIILVFTSSF